jgi:hypothetical protein
MKVKRNRNKEKATKNKMKRQAERMQEEPRRRKIVVKVIKSSCRMRKKRLDEQEVEKNTDIMELKEDI